MASVTLISMFTDDILYQIFYFLSLRQRIQACIICKRWRNVIASFDDNKLVQTNCGYCNRKTWTRSYYCDAVDYLIRLNSDNNTTFTEFYLFICSTRVSFDWNLVISESSLLLTVLYLKNCQISAENIGDSKELPFLKEIYLHATRMKDSTIFSEFIRKCPSLVELTLNNCYCRNFSVLVPNLLQLKKVHIVNKACRRGEIKEIEIKAQNLQELRLHSSSLSRSLLDLHACTKLQVLNVDCECIPFGFPTEITSAFPCLKSLFLRSNKEYWEFKFLSPNLENLTFLDVVHLDDVIIDSPIVHFKLKLLSNGSRLKEVEMKQILTINRLHALRNFAENLGENIILSLVVDPKEEKSDGRNPRSDLQPLCIRHLNLKIVFSLRRLNYVPLIDMLFSYFHPQALVVYWEVVYWEVSSLSRGSKFGEVLLGKLESRKRECSKSHQCSIYRCWHHLLKDYKILEKSTRGDNGKTTHNVNLVFEWSNTN